MNRQIADNRRGHANGASDITLPEVNCSNTANRCFRYFAAIVLLTGCNFGGWAVNIEPIFDSTVPSHAKKRITEAIGMWEAHLSGNGPNVKMRVRWLNQDVPGRASPTWWKSESGKWYSLAQWSQITGNAWTPSVADYASTQLTQEEKEARSGVHIIAEFDSIGVPWSFDNGETVPEGKLDFLSVVLHEIGHGLGFKERVLSDGTFPEGKFSLFDANLGWRITDDTVPFIGLTNSQ